MATESKVGRFLNNLRNTLKDHRSKEPRWRLDSPMMMLYLLGDSPRKKIYGESVATPPTTAASEYDRSPTTASPPRRRFRTSEIESISDAVASEKPQNKSHIRFNWRMARAFIQLRTQSAESFTLGGLPFPQWPKAKIPTLGASPSSCRVQEMFTVTLPEGTKVFVKIVPIQMWKYQWQQENEWDGEFTTDGENFVMEAAALAFLHEYAPKLAPRLIAILEISGNSEGRRRSSRVRVAQRLTDDDVTHMAIISELYGEDLLDFLDRRDRKNTPLGEKEKRALQIGCVLLMQKLHSLGLVHLDFTPENILIGPEGLRLCDFAKATPMWSKKLRHTQVENPRGSGNGGVKPPVLYSFESCEPTVGKGAYMPPECWKIYWRLEQQHILRPLEDLSGLRSAAERASYYFGVSAADIYMVGVVLFWIWSDGGIWKCSDPRQDEKYYHLLKGHMQLDLFRECRSWPIELKDCLTRVLCPDPWQRATIEEICELAWIKNYPEQEPERGFLSFYTSSHLSSNL